VLNSGLKILAFVSLFVHTFVEKLVRREALVMDDKCFFFAGGGTGGHIYPAVAVAEQLLRIEPKAKIHFFCSTRSIDSRILSHTGFEFTSLPAVGFTLRPRGLVGFCSSFISSYKVAKKAILKNRNTVVIGAGGFVSAPVCLAAHKNGIPIGLLNVDILPGKANRILARWANEIFVQFEQTKKFYDKTKAAIDVVGCPLRSGFANPQPQRAIEQLNLEKGKKILLITGASSGSENINRAICLLLQKLEAFAGDWQIVHLAGRNNLEKVQSNYKEAAISHKVIGYYDDMPDLLAAADLVIGRSGAVSVAEFAAAGVPSICIPYPYHKDRHQYLNAGVFVEAGAAVIVDDLPDENKRAQRLWSALDELMKDHAKRQKMTLACRKIAKPQAALTITHKLIGLMDKK
jgi:UDP-N-acetylglucosamine--N-acetylmuramyl-(pentapeptide) pyrophosphoryl-undecaprenol N-acetylglucosamine transferase